MAGFSQTKRSASPQADGQSPGTGGSMAPAKPLAQLNAGLQAGPAVEGLRNLHAQLAPVTQRMPDRTGLPGPLKQGIEALSGLSLDDVKVHRNSAEPAQMQAQAFARGTDIHLAPGQEQHLPHEAWHVVQQKQGRVAPTVQAFGQHLNTDPALEREADMMGARAVTQAVAAPNFHPIATPAVARSQAITQGKFLDAGGKPLDRAEIDKIIEKKIKKGAKKNEIDKIEEMAASDVDTYTVRTSRSGFIISKVKVKTHSDNSGIPFSFRYDHSTDKDDSMKIEYITGGILSTPKNGNTYENTLKSINRNASTIPAIDHKSLNSHDELMPQDSGLFAYDENSYVDEEELDDEDSVALKSNIDALLTPDTGEQASGDGEEKQEATTGFKEENSSMEVEEGPPREDLSPNILRPTLAAKSVTGVLAADRKRAVTQSVLMGIGPTDAAKAVGLPDAVKGNWEWLHMVAFSLEITHASELSALSQSMIQRTGQPQQIRENLALGTAASNTEMLSWETAIKRAMAAHKGMVLDLVAMPLIERRQAGNIVIPVCHFVKYQFKFECEMDGQQFLSVPMLVDFDTQSHTKPLASSFAKVNEAVNLAVGSLMDAVHKYQNANLNMVMRSANTMPAQINTNAVGRAEGIRTGTFTHV